MVSTIGMGRFLTYRHIAGGVFQGPVYPRKFWALFTIMELLSKSGRIPSELVPAAIGWGQGMALVIEAMLYDHDTVSEVSNDGTPPWNEKATRVGWPPA